MQQQNTFIKSSLCEPNTCFHRIDLYRRRVIVALAAQPALGTTSRGYRDRAREFPFLPSSDELSSRQSCGVAAVVAFQKITHGREKTDVFARR